MKKSITIITFLILIVACNTGNKDIYSYHKFNNHVWNRFDKLNFSIDIQKAGTYDILLEVAHTAAFDRERFSFNMIMNTPAGEERINEYSVEAKNNTGKFKGNCSGDSCLLVIPLKKEISLTPGKLNLEIESLIPYVETGNLNGVAIRIIKR